MAKNIDQPVTLIWKVLVNLVNVVHDFLATYADFESGWFHLVSMIPDQYFCELFDTNDGFKKKNYVLSCFTETF